MNIKFSCPHCKKPLKVKEEWAAKKAKCPACQKVLTIPTPSPPPASVEELAATALAEKPAAPPPPTPLVTVEFTCYYCEADLHLDASLAGKQAPCPQCKRIIKVPVLVKNEPKDWRGADPRATAKAAPAPEGAWGSATSAGSVSQGALIEAGAIPQKREPWALRQKLLVGSSAVALLAVVALFAWFGPSVYSRWRQDREIARKLETVSADGINAKKGPCQDAAVHLSAGEHYQRGNRSDSARQAEKHFSMARTLLMQAGPGRERTDLLIRLALAQIDLAGGKAEVDKGIRIPWDQAQREAEQTLQLLLTPSAKDAGVEAHREGLRVVSRKLIEQNQPQRAANLPLRFGEPEPDALVVVAQEMVRAGHKAVAARMAQHAITLRPSTGARSAGKPTGPSPALMALCKDLNLEIPDTIGATRPKQDKPAEPDLER